MSANCSPLFPCYSTRMRTELLMICLAAVVSPLASQRIWVSSSSCVTRLRDGPGNARRAASFELGACTWLYTLL